MSQGRDGDKARQEFDRAIKTAADAVSRAISAAFEIGSLLTQLINSITKSKARLRSGLQAGLTGTRNEGTPDERRSQLELAAQSLDNGIKQLTEENRLLQKSTNQLSILRGRLPGNDVPQGTQKSHRLDHLLKTASEKNEWLTRVNTKSVEPSPEQKEDSTLKKKGP